MVCLAPRSFAAEAPVTFEGDTLSIVHDGSQAAYNPHTEAGKHLLLEERKACCVEAPKGWHGESAPYVLNADEKRHLFHESARFVVNPRTGAFVSTTTFQDKRKPVTDPTRYVDSDITPMVALSDEQVAACNGCQPGDRVLLEDPRFHRTVWAVFGETVGPKDEGTAFVSLSPAAASALLIPLDPVTREPKQANYHLKLTIYPGSGPGQHFPHGALAPVRTTAQ